jgi:hypothetical protein
MAAHLLEVSLPSKTMEQAVEEHGLTLIQRRARPMLPEARFGEYGVQRVLGLVDSTVGRGQEPRQPLRDIKCAILVPLQDV